MVAGVTLISLIDRVHLAHGEHGSEGHGVQGPEHFLVELPRHGHGQGDVAVLGGSLLGDDGVELVLGQVPRRLEGVLGKSRFDALPLLTDRVVFL